MKRSLLIALMAALVATACAAPGSGGGTTELTASDSGSAISVSNGDTIVISLDANPTTGYTWQQAPGLDTSVVRFVSEDYQEAPAASPVVGGGGTDTLTYEAVGAGTTTIALGYQRSGDPTAVDSFTVTVTVSQ
jgi:inhibitor of cysteine peptidase